MRRVPKPHIACRYIVATHGTHTPQRIVLHDTESGDTRGIGDITGIAAYWRGRGDGLGTQFIIDAEGNIGQGCGANRITYGVAQHNTGTIHIEIIGRASWRPGMWLARRRQLRALTHLLAYLSDRWEIPLVHGTSRGVCRHMDFHGTGADHHDPGRGFPFRIVMRRARRYQRKMRHR